jgi:predicted ABC-type ATPase
VRDASDAPQLVMLAGPNGAGKSTFYRTFLARSPLPFLNADEFEARTGVASQEAARILDALRDDLVARGAGFITETVFSDPVGAKVALLRRAVEAGYFVALVYIAVEPELAALRVDQRVASGGHDVPRDRIAARFQRSLANLRDAIRFVTLAKVYDNSSLDEPYHLLATFERGKRMHVAKRLPRWARAVVRARAT